MKFAFWYKTENVTGKQDNTFKLTAHLRLIGTEQKWFEFPLEPGAHDWKYAEMTWKPDYTARQGAIGIYMSGRTGTVWIGRCFFGRWCPASMEEKKASSGEKAKEASSAQ